MQFHFRNISQVFRGVAHGVIETKPFLRPSSIQTPDAGLPGFFAPLTTGRRHRKILDLTMYPAGNLFINVPHGRLEAILKQPPDEGVRGTALVLHPHPLGGGTMHNKVVFRAAAALNEAGLVTLRINFRGVGQSTGTHDEGQGERDDALAGLHYLAQHFPAQDITLCGFSFGARVGLEVGIRDDRVPRLISIGTPVDKYDFSFIRACRKPILFVHGEYDEYGNLERLRALIDTIEAPVKLAVIKGAGHFFDDQLDDLKSAIREWIAGEAGRPLSRGN
jgi:alpha/beta superfamily hydrolase